MDEAEQFRRPGVNTEFIPRSALLGSVLAPPHRGLVVLGAPAGYGKTWLLTQAAAAWSSFPSAQGSAVTWRLQGRTTVLQALRSFCAIYGRQADPVAANPEAAVEMALALLGTEPLPGLLVLDLDGMPPSKAVLTLVVQVILEIAQRGFVLVACRSTQLLPLDRLSALAPLRVLCTRDLAFRSSEIAHAQGLAADVAEHWLRVTEGWPVVCGGAPWRSARGQASVSDALADHLAALFADYLENELLALLPARDIRLLMQVSIFEAVEPGMLEAIEVTGPWSRLANLVDSGLPLSNAQADADRIVLHPLFRRFLQRRLRLHAPALHHSLHRRAAHYFAAAGAFGTAMTHAQQTGDPLFQAQITESHGGWRMSLREGLRALSPGPADRAELAERFPRALLARIYWQAQTGRVEEARAALEHLDARSTISAPDNDRLAIRAVISIYRDEDFDERQIERLSQIRPAAHEEEPLLLPGGATLQAAVLNNAGLYERGAQAARAAIVEAEALGSPYVEFYGQLQYALALHGLGRVASASPGYSRARELALEVFGENSGECRIIFLLLAHAAWLSGQDEPAQRAVDGLDGFHRLHAWVDPYTRLLQIASTMARTRGGQALQDRVLRDFSDLAARRCLPRLQALIAVCRARQAVTDAQLDEAQAHCQAAFEIMSGSGLHSPQTLAGVMGPAWAERARIALVRNAFDEAGTALMQLREWRSHAQDGVLAMQAGLLEAYVALRARRYREASLELTRCVQDAELSGLRRPFMDEAARVLELVDYAGDHALKVEARVLQRAAEFARGGLPAAARDGRRSPSARSGLLLTERETDILDRKSTRLNSSHNPASRMPSSA
jgi:ATP/maltotriose-dependent transcriptional regulator MalT